MTSHVIYKNTK